MSLAVAFFAFGALCWAAGYYSHEWPRRPDEALRQRLEAMDALERNHVRFQRDVRPR